VIATVSTCILVVDIATPLTVEKIGLERMTRESNVIIYGRIRSTYSQWEGKNIFTYSSIQVYESPKGWSERTVIVKQTGGKVGDIGLEVDGTPKLNRGEDVVLFLVQWQGHLWIHSIVLGKFSVVREEGDLVAYNDLNNVGLIDPVTKQEIVDPTKKTNHFPLASFMSEIRSYIND